MTEPGRAWQLPVPSDSGAGARMPRPPQGGPARYFGQAAVPGATPQNLLTVAWRSRWIILVCILVTLVGGFIYIKTATPMYTSTSKLYLDYVDIRPSAVVDSSGPPQVERYLYTQAELIKSRPILAMAVQALEDERLRAFVDVKVPIAFVDKNLKVEVGRRDDIVSISFKSPYPVETAQIVNRVVEAYMTSRSEHEQRNAAQVLRILQGAEASKNEELAAKEKELADYQANHTLLTLGSDERGTLVQRHLEELQIAWVRAQNAVMEAESFLDGVKLFTDDPRALRQYVQGGGNIPGLSGAAADRLPLENRLTELDLQIEELSAKLTPDHPSVAALTAQRDRIRTQLEKLDADVVSAVLASAERHHAEAKSSEAQIAARYRELEEQAGTINLELQQYVQLRATIDRLTQDAQGLAQQVQEIGRIVNEDVGQVRMSILEPASVAMEPSEPQKGKIMAMAMMMGVLVGGGIAVARDWLSQVIRSVDEISAMLGLPVLGTVPAMPRRQPLQTRGQRVFLQPDSQEAEAFRTIRTAVLFSAPKDRAKTLLVTSPASGDGKSTLVSNLGIAMASAGHKTIIVDADLRKPMQHTIFGVDHRKKSLSSVFARRMRLRDAIQSTGIGRLSLLTCGEGFSDPAEVLSGTMFATLLKSLAEAYDKVLIDAPPVVVVTDAQILGARSDSTVLVVKADKTTGKMARHAIDALQRVGAHLLGVVVNDVPRRDSHYGYYETYRGSHRSGSNGHKGKEASRPSTWAGRPASIPRLTSA